jgi:hypothetical protein
VVLFFLEESTPSDDIASEGVLGHIHPEGSPRRRAKARSPGIPDRPRQSVSSLVIGELAGRLPQHFEALRAHHLDQRRYMFRVQA